MNIVGLTELWHRFDFLERSLCLRANRSCRNPVVRQFFAAVSRLGDGVLWYVVMFGLALGGEAGAAAAVQMAGTSVAGLAIYRQLKHRLVRERPYAAHPGFLLGTAPLDRYSFPSGHTLHAVHFTLVATAHVPELALGLVPFTLLIAASRVVLGLHYPTDVAAGALIGGGLAAASLALWPT
jgi:undecaprenyl-diphosphatase